MYTILAFFFSLMSLGRRWGGWWVLSIRGDLIAPMCSGDIKSSMAVRFGFLFISPVIKTFKISHTQCVPTNENVQFLNILQILSLYCSEGHTSHYGMWIWSTNTYCSLKSCLYIGSNNKSLTNKTLKILVSVCMYTNVVYVVQMFCSGFTNDR